MPNANHGCPALIAACKSGIAEPSDIETWFLRSSAPSQLGAFIVPYTVVTPESIAW